MTGVLLARSQNTQTAIDNVLPWHDDDFNLCIRPDNAYKYLSYNQQTNDRTPARKDCESQATMPAGMVEAEFRPSTAIPWSWAADRFPEGSAVSTYGWWPHDNGHPEEDKPSEIHPLLWFGTQGPLPTVYLMAGQDLSGRFSVANNPIEETVNVMYAPGGRGVVQAGANGTVPVNVLREIANAPQMGADVAADHVGITLYFPACPCGLNWLLGGASLTPFAYSAELQHSLPPLLSETVTFDTPPDEQTGLRYGRVTVQLSIASPPSGSLQFLDWNWVNNPPGMPQRVHQAVPPTQPITQAGNQAFSQTFSLKYSPRDGDDQTTWNLDISGATVPQSALAIVRRDNSATDPVGYDRTFVGVQRGYSVQPSTISLSTDLPALKWRQRGCPATQTVTLNTTKLLGGSTELSTAVWSIRRTTDDATGAPADAWQTLSEANGYSYTSPEMIFQENPTDPTHVNLTFPQQNEVVSHETAVVAVVMTTEIGEFVTDAIEIQAECPIDPTSRPAPWDRRHPHSPFPDDRLAFQRGETERLVARLAVKAGYSLGFDEFPAGIRAADTGWVHAYVDWAGGAALSRGQRLQLDQALIRARLLPELTAESSYNGGKHAAPNLAMTPQANLLPARHANSLVQGSLCPNRAVGLTTQSAKRETLTCAPAVGGRTQWIKR